MIQNQMGKEKVMENVDFFVRLCYTGRRMDNREKKLKIHAKTHKKRMAVFVQNFAGGTERNSLNFRSIPPLFRDCPINFQGKVSRKMRTQKISKVLAAFLSVLLFFSIGTTAFADEFVT